jgi:hypothetical protein
MNAIGLLVVCALAMVMAVRAAYLAASVIADMVSGSR